MTRTTYRPSCLTRRAACHVTAEAAGLPAYLSDLRPVRGKCRRPRCQSRWAVVRITLDFRDPERIERFAATECVKCGHVWRRVAEPRITSPAGYQAVRLTLILPATFDRWYSRGRWHREGDDAVILGEAHIADLDEATRAHRKRADSAATRKAAARARAEAAAIADHERTMSLLARLEVLDAARAAEDREAAIRES